LDFDDSSWETGLTGIGYENSPADYAGLIATEVPNGTDGVYVRMEFEVTDRQSLDSLLLRVKYDDGFIAYLNGSTVPVAAANAPTRPNFQSVATGNHPDQDAAQFVDFEGRTENGLLRHSDSWITEYDGSYQPRPHHSERDRKPSCHLDRSIGHYCRGVTTLRASCRRQPVLQGHV
jgi:hypothetical protein